MPKFSVGTPVTYYPGNGQKAQPGQIAGLRGDGTVLIVSYCTLYNSYQKRDQVPHGKTKGTHYFTLPGEES